MPPWVRSVAIVMDLISVTKKAHFHWISVEYEAAFPHTTLVFSFCAKICKKYACTVTEITMTQQKLQS